MLPQPCTPRWNTCETPTLHHRHRLAAPDQDPPRKYSPADQEKIKEFIDEGLKSGVISESESPWSFPIVIAEKQDGFPPYLHRLSSLQRSHRQRRAPDPPDRRIFPAFFGRQVLYLAGHEVWLLADRDGSSIEAQNGVFDSIRSLPLERPSIWQRPSIWPQEWCCGIPRSDELRSRQIS